MFSPVVTIERTGPLARHCERQRSNPVGLRGKLDCFVAIAPRMTRVSRRYGANYPSPLWGGEESHKRLDAGLGAAENQGVNVVSALVGVHGFQIGEHAHHMEFFGNAVA